MPAESAVTTLALTTIPPDTARFGPGTFDLPDPAVGLDSLAGYAASLVVSFDGSRDGLPLQVTRSATFVTTKDPAARMATTDLPASGSAPTVQALVDGYLYTSEAGAACDAAPTEEGDVAGELVPEPALELSGFLGADLADSNALDGIAVQHATFDERALGLQDTSKIAGEVWVAIDGGYVVRYTLVSDGPAAFLGPGVEGTLAIEYTLSSIGETPAIALPGDCPVMIEAPLAEGAIGVEHRPGSLSYVTPSPSVDVLTFYQQELSALGWQPSSATAIIAPEGGRLEFERGDDQLTIVVATGESETVVLMLMQ